MRLCFFLQGQETVAWVLVHDAILWQITRGALATFFGLGEEINRLWLTAAQSDFLLVQVVGDAFTVSMFVGHEVPP